MYSKNYAEECVLFADIENQDLHESVNLAFKKLEIILSLFREKTIGKLQVIMFSGMEGNSLIFLLNRGHRYYYLEQVYTL